MSHTEDNGTSAPAPEAPTVEAVTYDLSQLMLKEECVHFLFSIACNARTHHPKLPATHRI